MACDGFNDVTVSIEILLSVLITVVIPREKPPYARLRSTARFGCSNAASIM